MERSQEGLAGVDATGVARTHARIYLRIWANRDFRRLSPNAKLTYLEIITQPDLSYCGVLAYNPTRWAALIGWDDAKVSELAIEELECADFVVVDREEHELWVKGFIKYDGVLDQGKVKFAMFDAIERVMSTELQRAIRAQVAELEALPKPMRSPSEGEGDFHGVGEGVGATSNPTTNSSSSSSSRRSTTRARTRGIAQYPDDFETFWAAGLQKVDKRETFGAWNARIHEGATPAELITAVQNYVAAQQSKGKTDPEYWKRPKTFVGPNDIWREWLDEERLQVVLQNADSPLVRTMLERAKRGQHQETE